MTSYLVTIASDHHLTCLKICARDERTDVLSSMKKLRKTLWGLGSSHPSLYVRGLNLNQNEQGKRIVSTKAIRINGVCLFTFSDRKDARLRFSLSTNAFDKHSSTFLASLDLADLTFY